MKLPKLKCNRDKLGRFIKGHKNISNNKGKKFPEMGKKRLGKNNPNWNDNPTYRTIHAWLVNNFGKANKCGNKLCLYPKKNTRGRIMLKPKKFNWALKKGRKYSRNIKDYYQLCAKCHSKYDRKNNDKDTKIKL